MPGVQTAILAHQFNCNSDTINSSLCLGPSAAPASCFNYQAHASALVSQLEDFPELLARVSPQLAVSSPGVNSTSASDHSHWDLGQPNGSSLRPQVPWLKAEAALFGIPFWLEMLQSRGADLSAPLCGPW